MNGVSTLNIVEEITLITFSKIPSDVSLVSDMLSMVSEKEINIDMISLTNTHSGFNSLSFTVSDSDLGAILAVTAAIKERYPSYQPLISAGTSSFLCLERK